MTASSATRRANWLWISMPNSDRVTSAWPATWMASPSHRPSATNTTGRVTPCTDAVAHERGAVGGDDPRALHGLARARGDDGGGRQLHRRRRVSRGEGQDGVGNADEHQRGHGDDDGQARLPCPRPDPHAHVLPPTAA